ncbi:MAG: TetR family transcriptional regulator [Chitinophagales bacterium]|nr:MAG: TetR family transcriptional regulator [Chitinophagales bacterium]
MTVLISKRKEEILHAAKTLFREKGYAGTSMRDIAKVVGIEPASLYSHFKSKDDILQFICFEIAREFLEMQEPILNSMTNPTEKLRRVIAGHVAIVMHNLEAASVFFNEWKHMREPELSRFVELRELYEDGFKRIMEEGITSGDFKNVEVHFFVRMLFSVINEVHEWYRTTGRVAPDEVGEMMSEFVLYGIAIQ